MGTKKLSLALLISFMNLLLEQFKEIKEDLTYIPFNKLGKVNQNFESIKNFILTRTNSIFFVVSKDKDGLIIRNIDHINDHITYYRITISDSCETYMVESIDYISEPVIQLKKKFDETKL